MIDNYSKMGYVKQYAKQKADVFSHGECGYVKETDNKTINSRGISICIWFYLYYIDSRDRYHLYCFSVYELYENTIYCSCFSIIVCSYDCDNNMYYHTRDCLQKK